MIEYLSNTYIISFIITIICLGIVYLYDKFEKKQYTGAIYFRFTILLYICSYLTLYMSSYLTNYIQQGGSNALTEITNNIPKQQGFETFKTGIPTF
jgi:hypothetical protein